MPARCPAPVGRIVPVVLGALALTIGIGACAATGPRPRPTAAASHRALYAEEIRSVGAITALDALRRLRPQWLRSRPPASLSDQVAGLSGPQIVVYLDNVRSGGIDALQTIRADEVASMEYLDGPNASIRFGTGHEGGAILVRTHQP